MSLRRSGLVVSLLALTAALGTAPVGALPEAPAPALVLTPASGLVGTTVTVTNAPSDANGKCTGGLIGDQDVDLDVVGPAGDGINSTEPNFNIEAFVPAATGDWRATFIVPAGLMPGDEIRVSATCTTQPLTATEPNTFEYAPTVFTVTAAPTSGGGTTTTTRGGTITGGTTIPPGESGSTPVPTPLAVQPRFTG